MKSAAYYSSNSRMYSTKTSLDNFNLTEEELNKELDNISKDVDKTDNSK